MSTGDVMGRPPMAVRATLLATLLLVVAGCQSSVTSDQARQVLAAIEQGDQPADLVDVLNSPEAAAVVADEVVDRIRIAVAQGLDPLPDPLISPARFSDPILAELLEDALLLAIMERSDQTGQTWGRALYIALLADVPGVEPVGQDHFRPNHVPQAMTDFVAWRLWSDDVVQPILVDLEPDAPEQVDFDTFRRFEYARNVAIGVSSPLSRELIHVAP